MARYIYGRSLATSTDPNRCECGEVIDDDADICLHCAALEAEADAEDRAADEALNIEREANP